MSDATAIEVSMPRLSDSMEEGTVLSWLAAPGTEDASLMTLTLSCDHRILYGAEAARFLAAIRDLLEAPLGVAL